MVHVQYKHLWPHSSMAFEHAWLLDLLNNHLHTNMRTQSFARLTRCILTIITCNTWTAAMDGYGSRIVVFRGTCNYCTHTNVVSATINHLHFHNPWEKQTIIDTLMTLRKLMMKIVSILHCFTCINLTFYSAYPYIKNRIQISTLLL